MLNISDSVIWMFGSAKSQIPAVCVVFLQFSREVMWQKFLLFFQVIHNNAPI
jgi:hypothetical protein